MRPPARLRSKLSPGRSPELWRELSSATAGRNLKLRRHSDQFRQRFSLHLAHHVPPLDLHRDFAGPEIKSYLLIEHAPDHQTHNLALACGQRFMALSQSGQLTLMLACRPVAI